MAFGVIIMREKYFFDIPVYRLAREKYDRKRNAYVEESPFPTNSSLAEATRALDKANPRQNDMVRSNSLRWYGGCWEFNEIIGYIRLHFLGSQVRGEYYSVRRKRIVRTRTKTFEYKTWKLAPEIEIPNPPTQTSIFGAIRTYLDGCKRELPRRFIDTSMFEAVASHIDWLALYRLP